MNEQVDEVMEFFVSALEVPDAREMFARVGFTLHLLKLSRPEEAYEAQDARAKLGFSANDVKRVLNLRVEFDTESVTRLRI
jgi:hypothetical protein